LGLKHTAVYLAQRYTATHTLQRTATAGEASQSLPHSLPIPPPTSLPTVSHLLPLTSDGQLVGLLVLGERWDGARFDEREQEILDLIAQQSAIFLRNVQQTSQLRQADQELIHMQEETRRKTSQDLHDHVLPALSQLQLQLQTTQLLLTDQPAQATAQLSEGLARLKENTAVVRRIQQNLGVRPLEYGLATYLEEMLQRFRQESGINIEAHFPPDLDNILTARESRHALYSVWQEALNNIRTHAHATQVSITLSQQGDCLTFSIADNGRGSTPQARDEAIANQHFGLRSMQIRLESVGGGFNFASTPNQGSVVSGWLPATI
jgi:signal transduction histidine kinase